MPSRNVILIGYRGCGKTCVGRELAARLHWPFVDTDEQVEATAGRSIREIFEQDGEVAFRQLEPRAIADVTRASGQVIAVGGGALLSAANRAALRQAGVCVWLTAPATELRRRLRADPRTGATRPALTARGGLAAGRPAQGGPTGGAEGNRWPLASRPVPSSLSLLSGGARRAANDRAASVWNGDLHCGTRRRRQ